MTELYITAFHWRKLPMGRTAIEKDPKGISMAGGSTFKKIKATSPWVEC